MITAGIDIGSLTAKAIVLELDTNQLLGRYLMPTGLSPQQAGSAALTGALADAGLQPEALQASVGTGYGRVAVQGVDWRITELTCHARGAWTAAGIPENP